MSASSRPDRPSAPARPRVTLSYAQTLDGRLATRSGSSQWISGLESLRFAHQLRASHDAIMVGIGTVLSDDPQLTARLVELLPGQPQPLRVVVDSTLRTPPVAKVVANGAASGTVIATTGRAPAARRKTMLALGAELLLLPENANGAVDLVALLDALGERGVGSLLVEGGARLITALLRERLVDRMAVCIAPMILGAGIEAVGELGIVDLARALRLHEPRRIACGDDLVLEGAVVYPEDDNASSR